jgi:predicted RNase H-like HicB family nuclease
MVKQVKIYAEPELAEAFKNLCAKGGTSVTAELCEYMRKRTQLKEPTTVTGNRTDRRWQRKAAARRIVSLLRKIRDAEESYRAGIPENLSCGPMAETAEETVERLEEAIAAVQDAYAV